MSDEIKLRDELEEAKKMVNVKIEFPNQDDNKNFIVTLKVDEGLYRNKWFHFAFSITEKWPLYPPTVHIKDKIWHPSYTTPNLIHQDMLASTRLDI